MTHTGQLSNAAGPLVAIKVCKHYQALLMPLRDQTVSILADDSGHVKALGRVVQRLWQVRTLTHADILRHPLSCMYTSTIYDQDLDPKDVPHDTGITAVQLCSAQLGLHGMHMNIQPGIMIC